MAIHSINHETHPPHPWQLAFPYPKFSTISAHQPSPKYRDQSHHSDYLHSAREFEAPRDVLCLMHPIDPHTTHIRARDDISVRIQ